MRRLLVIALAMLAATLASPLAMAEYDPAKPPCPEGMACTTSMEDEAPGGNETAANESATDEPAPVDAGSTCMDGQQEGEACRDDVQYLDGGGATTTPPADDGASGDDADPVERVARNVPRVGVAVILSAFAAMALFLGRHRERR